MTPVLPLALAGIAWITRLAVVLRLWNAPRKNGEHCFLAQPVGARFYAGAGAGIERRFRVALTICLLLDAPVVFWLAATKQYALLAGEAFIALVLAGVANNLILAHFANRAALLAGLDDERAATAFQISMSPRRLDDHTNWLVEAVVATAIAASLVMVARAHAVAAEPWVTCSIWLIEFVI